MIRLIDLEQAVSINILRQKMALFLDMTYGMAGHVFCYDLNNYALPETLWRHWHIDVYSNVFYMYEFTIVQEAVVTPCQYNNRNYRSGLHFVSTA